MIETKQQGQILMWGARIGGLIISGFWLYRITDFFLNAAFLQTLEGSLLTLLVVCSSVAAVYAWIDPLSGGKFTIVSSIFLTIFAYFAAAQDRMMAVVISGLPYFLIGLLFVQSQNTEENKH